MRWLPSTITAAITAATCGRFRRPRPGAMSQGISGRPNHQWRSEWGGPSCQQAARTCQPGRSKARRPLRSRRELPTLQDFGPSPDRCAGAPVPETSATRPLISSGIHATRPVPALSRNHVFSGRDRQRWPASCPVCIPAGLPASVGTWSASTFLDIALPIGRMETQMEAKSTRRLEAWNDGDS